MNLNKMTVKQCWIWTYGNTYAGTNIIECVTVHVLLDQYMLWVIIAGLKWLKHQTVRCILVPRVRLWYLQCISNGDTTVLHLIIATMVEWKTGTFLSVFKFEKCEGPNKPKSQHKARGKMISKQYNKWQWLMNVNKQHIYETLFILTRYLVDKLLSLKYSHIV